MSCYIGNEWIKGQGDLLQSRDPLGKELDLGRLMKQTFLKPYKRFSSQNGFSFLEEHRLC